jgi:hypothetical protein
MTIGVNLGRTLAKRPLDPSSIRSCLEAEHGQGARARGVRTSGRPGGEGFSLPWSPMQSFVR